MFTVASNTRTAPATAPLFVAPEAGASISDYLEGFKATDMTTKSTLGAMVFLMAEKAEEPAAGLAAEALALRANCARAFAPGAAAAIVALCAVPGAGANTENDQVIRAILDNQAACPGWMVDLINAAHKKPLDDVNVEGYFASINHTGTKASAVAQVINKLLPYFPDNISNPAFRANLVDNVWTTYRTTRVSTGKILEKLLPDFRILSITTAGDAGEVAIIASANAPWDINLANAIADKYKAYGCIFHEASGTPIDKWYQGNKARDEMPAARVRGIKEVFRRYLEVKSNVGGLAAITDTAAFTTPAYQNFFA